MAVNDIQIRNSDGDFESIFPIPIEQGGTGETTAADAWSALHPENTVRYVNQTSNVDTGFGVQMNGSNCEALLAGVGQQSAGLWDYRTQQWMVYSNGTNVRHAEITQGYTSSTAGTQSNATTINWYWTRIYNRLYMNTTANIPFGDGSNLVRTCTVYFPFTFSSTPTVVGSRVQNGNAAWELSTVFEVQRIGNTSADVCLKCPSLVDGYLSSNPTWETVSIFVCGYIA